MTLKSLRAMPWIGELPVLDLANTVLLGAGTAGGDIDLLADPELLASWRAKAADRELADLPLGQLTDLRDPVRGALDAAARQAPLPGPARTRLNALAARAPVTFQVDGAGRLTEREAGGPVAAVVARQALVLAAGPEQARLRCCPAPSCGMFFLARRQDQAWCSIACGNRARARAARRSGRHAD
ncbi:ABATE domain-containing protein [Streptomyces sp. TRM72054]|uniref:ABATE domain-containing protein n=1 Tax=Streptomyces sp. TRM72054 TaxID=2870562 RepID=UPI001C8C6044|nr:ABATE domain-containing protein [Streptomyces sp. TRM72054]MBX9397691.1 ABATE domain-containing protein [Streptomyces sp. TRM72054]